MPMLAKPNVTSIRRFLEWLFDDAEGNVCINTGHVTTEGKLAYSTRDVTYFAWPADSERAVEFVRHSAQSLDVTMMVTLSDGKGRNEGNSLGGSVIYIDIDAKDFVGRESELAEHRRWFESHNATIVESGSGAGFHAYLKLPYRVDPDKLKTLSGKLAKHFGGDTKYNPAALLRVAGTVNYKHRAPASNNSGLTGPVPVVLAQLSTSVLDDATVAEIESWGSATPSVGDVTFNPDKLPEAVRKVFEAKQGTPEGGQNEAAWACLLVACEHNVSHIYIREAFEFYGIDDKYETRGGGIEAQILKAQAVVDTKRIEAADNFACTDVGNGQRLAKLLAGTALYVDEWQEWVRYDGKRWVRRADKFVANAGKTVARNIMQEAYTATHEVERNERRKWSKASQSDYSQRAMLSQASSEPSMLTNANAFDRDIWALNVDNGVLNLRTGELAPHKPEDKMTRMAPVKYNPDATCPKWLNLLHVALEGNAELIRSLQVALGYCMTGSAGGEAMFVLYGESGANGKSTIVNTVRKIFGMADGNGYAQEGVNRMLLEKSKNDKLEGEHAALHGARFVYYSELKDTDRFAVDDIKRLTSKGTLRGRELYQKAFTFDITHKNVVMTNKMPALPQGADGGLWRRMKVFPFNVRLLDVPGFVAVPDFDDVLVREEASGILNWLLEGAIEYANHGLTSCKDIVEATDAYKTSSIDSVTEFVNDTYDRTGNRDDVVTLKDLRVAYMQWRIANGGTEYKSDRAFANALWRTVDKDKSNAGAIARGLRRK